ncbi:MAG: hypothetical protein MN733_41095, partial [Nitrososphaera sp.]|nr:hypothetical protein [Nitrososphaera sp.]
TWAMVKAIRAHNAETPKQTSLHLRLRASHFYLDRYIHSQGANMTLFAVFLAVLAIAIHSASKFGKVNIAWVLGATILGGLMGLSRLAQEFQLLNVNPQAVYGEAAGAGSIWFILYYIFSGRKKKTG